MIIKYGSVTYDLNPIVRIGSLIIDLKRAEDWEKLKIHSPEFANAGMYLDTLGYPSYTRTILDIDGVTSKQITVPAKQGIDLQTAPFNDIVTFMNNANNESTKEYCRKCLALRFPAKFNQERSNVSQSLKEEYRLISQTPNKDTKWLSSCVGGIMGYIRMDGSMRTKPRRFVVRV